jgi:hypothetical protein
MTTKKFRRSGPIVLAVLVLAVAVPGYLAVDKQMAVARDELGRLQSRYERSDRLLKVSANLAPGGDADLAGLDREIKRLTGGEAAPTADVFPACEAEAPSSVWLPLLEDSVGELAQRVATLCARANETPARTARIMTLHQLDAMRRSAEAIRQ